MMSKDGSSALSSETALSSEAALSLEVDEKREAILKILATYASTMGSVGDLGSHSVR
jgi:hypothetical protein